MSDGRLRVETRRGDAGALHASWPLVEGDPTRRAVAWCRVTGAAVVLGSTQPDEAVDDGRARRAGLLVARRRSGGGAVLVLPDDPAWVDVWVPRGDPWWNDDVGRSFDAVGEVWAAALAGLGIASPVVHRDPSRACTSWSSLVCFGGVGHGEVLTEDGRKLVGLSQRRTRAGAWFHGACPIHWDPDPLLEVLALDDPARGAAARDLARVATGAADEQPGLDAAAVADAVVAQLTRLTDPG